jgi:hypothetical protein
MCYFNDFTDPSVAFHNPFTNIHKEAKGENIKWKKKNKVRWFVVSLIWKGISKIACI